MFKKLTYIISCIAISTIFVSAFAVYMDSNNSARVFAADNPTAEACKTAPDNPLCRAQKSPTKDNPVTTTVGKVIKLFAIIAGAVAVIWIIYGGFRFVTSYGDPQKTAAARETILYALIGLIVIIVAQTLIAFIINRIAK